MTKLTLNQLKEITDILDRIDEVGDAVTDIDILYLANMWLCTFMLSGKKCGYVLRDDKWVSTKR